VRRVRLSGLRPVQRAGVLLAHERLAIMTLAPVPSLDQVATNPTVVRQLPEQALVDLALQAQRVVTACQTALLAIRPTRAPIQEAGDRLLTTAEAAPRLGVAAKTLYQTRRRYPFYVDLNGRPRFSEKGLQEFIRMRQQGA
jgi:hypothetical protein